MDIKFTSICQCCLADDAPMKNMLTETYHEVKLIETFIECSGIDLLKDQPKETNCKNICLKCESKLLISIEFRELCHTSQKKLKERLLDIIKDEPVSDEEPLAQYSTRSSKRNRALFTQVYVKLQEEAPPVTPKLEETQSIVADTKDQNDDYCNNNDYVAGHDSDSEDDSSAPPSKIVKIAEAHTETAADETNETSTMPISIMCYHCDEFLSTQKNFLEHMKKHHVDVNGKKVSSRITRKCYVCKKEVVGYVKHLRKEHYDFKPHTCKQCKMTFSRPGYLRNHLYRHMKAKRFNCMGCKMIFKTKAKLHVHINAVKHSKILYHCTGCGLGFKEFILMNEHYHKEHKNDYYKNLYPCYRCKRVFIIREVAQDHKCKSSVAAQPKNQRAHHECPQCEQKFTTSDEMVCHKFTFCDLKLPCKVADCKKHFKTNQEVASHFAEEHITKSKRKPQVREKTKLERHVCDECGLVLSNIWILQKHKHKIHDPNYINERKLYPCSGCDKVLLTKYSFEHHVAVFHTDRKFFECHFCPKKFCSLMSIRAHVVEHASNPTALLTVECGMCHKKFVDQQNLHQHRKVHIVANQNRNLRCEQCPDTFKNSVLLRKHVKKEHERIYYECCHCKCHFATQPAFKCHMFEHRGFRPFHCPICANQFVRKYLFSEHLKLKHGIKFDQNIHGYVELEQEEQRSIWKLCERKGKMPDADQVHRHRFKNTSTSSTPCNSYGGFNWST